jgi:DNA repair exonuclease SbcCD nuclease subunit
VSKATADIVVVHSSDLHVDDGYTARAHGGDGTGPLRRVLQAAQAVAANVVLLAGDTFEHNRLPAALLDRVADLLQEMPIPVVILPGNHDPAIPDSVYHRSRIAEPPHVHVLGVTHEAAVHFADLDLEIWGHAHRDYDDMAPLRAPRARRTRWQIAAAHGHYEARPDRRSPLQPSWLISDAEIEATGADYVALGHWNTPRRVGRRGVPAYYSGSPDLAGTVNVVRLKPDGRVAVRRQPLK